MNEHNFVVNVSIRVLREVCVNMLLLLHSENSHMHVRGAHVHELCMLIKLA